MKNYRRPSLKAVSTFEAAARHESFKGAAEELSLTPSAISHQVRQLEEHLGVKLFHRLSGGLAITDAGSAYLKMLSPVFSDIDDATKQIMQIEYTDRLTVRITAIDERINFRCFAERRVVFSFCSADFFFYSPLFLKRSDFFCGVAKCHNVVIQKNARQVSKSIHPQRHENQ